MELINEAVIHKTYGEGNIIEIKNSHITVKFQNSLKKFKYPNVFEGFLTIKNTELSKKINQLIKEEKTIENKKVIEKTKKVIANIERKKTITKNLNSNIAFKCNFCDGGETEKQVGFNGVCSDEIIKNNIKIEKRSWCTSDDCPCNEYINGYITRYELEENCEDGGFVCYESQMLREWKAFAGIVKTGTRKNEPMKLKQVQNNSLCILTTRDPNSKESTRYIFAIFMVNETYEGDNQEEGHVSANSKYRIKLSPTEAHKMLFWNYHVNGSSQEKAHWGSGLHRYIGNDESVQILKDIIKVKTDTKEEKFANEFFEYFIEKNNIDISLVSKKNGALKR